MLKHTILLYFINYYENAVPIKRDYPSHDYPIEMQ